jgi:molybdenum cofactor cytidylyltransferase
MTKDLRMGDANSDRSDFRSFGIVPAAGRSVRMGQPKLLLPWTTDEGTQTVLEQVLAAWCASQVTHVVVVLHPEDAALAEICRRTRAHTVVAPIPPPDMKASIQRGLEFVAARFAPSDNDVFLVAPADMPLLTSSAIDLVLAAHDPKQREILVPRAAGRRGHPVLFPWPLVTDVARLPADVGLNQLLRATTVRELETQQASILADLDTPEDYKRLQDRS